MTTHPVTIVTINSTADFGYEYYLIDASNNNVTLTLPSASISDGLFFGIRRIDNNVSNTASIAGDSNGETLDGSVSLPLLSGDKVTVISINSVWYTV